MFKLISSSKCICMRFFHVGCQISVDGPDDESYTLGLLYELLMGRNISYWGILKVFLVQDQVVAA